MAGFSPAFDLWAGATGADRPTPRRVAAAFDLLEHLDAVTAGVNVSGERAPLVYPRSGPAAPPPGLGGIEVL